MKKILVLTDSLGLPRAVPEQTLYEETWPYALKKQGYFVHQVSIGEATSEDLKNQIFYHKMYEPDLVIVQVGIVDCAPRFATQFELALLNRIPFFGKFIINFLKTKQVRKLRQKTYVILQTFEINIKNIQDCFTVPVYFISIINATTGYEEKLNVVTNNIKRYYTTLKSISKYYIDLNNLPIQGIMADFHHINHYGHRYIYDLIIKEINA